MSHELRAKYVGGSLTGVDLNVLLDNGEIRNVHIDHGADLPSEVGGEKVSAGFRDSLLAQSENFSKVNRATGDEVKPKADAGRKDGDS